MSNVSPEATEEVTEEAAEAGAEEAQAEAEEEQAEYKAKYFEALKKKALLDAGFTFDQLSTYKKYVAGESAEAIERAAEELYEEVASHVKPADSPAMAQRRKQTWNPFK
ncbi:hypothetical protein [Gracilibacillus timonensis]|uniref:hypothetical protein n=1 Tax=Gracilibacillus timonensis TaxID=1816696 RepID=UPI0008260FD8|nr:hypothetical protein [Gracilibacillus timonensis]